MELDRVFLEEEIVHEHLNVRERGHERARNLRDLRGIAAVDRDRAAGRVVVGHSGGIMAAPRLGVRAPEVMCLILIE